MKIIDGLYFTIGMILFNPLTGESRTPDQLNEDDRTTYDACMGAIALLKAQEPIAPVKVNRYMETDENGEWFSPETYDCGNCGVELHGKANYCHLCGRAVKWE